jgi:hypothetical protein
MNRDEAITSAVAFLTGLMGPGLVHPELGQIVLRLDYVGEHDLAWILPFNSVAYLRDGDVSRACAPSVVLVPQNGDPVFIPPSYLPISEFLDAAKEDGRGMGGLAEFVPRRRD